MVSKAASTTPAGEPVKQAGKELAATAHAPVPTITTPDQSYLSQEQIRQLLTMVDGLRVQQVQGKSNMAAYDIRAHLNRIFGFGRWDGNVTTMDLIFESPITMNSGKPGYEVAYKAGYELTVRAPAGNHLATYTEYAVGAQKMGITNRGDVHDFAMKTAESQALKRAAINLGDQFGLSLYNKGSMGPLVGGTFLIPGRHEPEVLAGPTEQLHEETDPDLPDAVQQQEPQQAPQQQQQQRPTQYSPAAAEQGGSGFVQQPQPQQEPPQQQPQQAQEQPPAAPQSFPEGSIEHGRAELQQDIAKLPPANKNRLMNLWGKTDLPPLYKIGTEDQLATAWGLFGQVVPAAPEQEQEAPQQPAPASQPAQPAPRDDNNFYAAQA